MEWSNLKDIFLHGRTVLKWILNNIEGRRMHSSGSWIKQVEGC